MDIRVKYIILEEVKGSKSNGNKFGLFMLFDLISVFFM